MNREQWIKIGKGALIAVGGALLTYSAEFVIPALEDTGHAALLILAAAASVSINVARKWLESLKK